MSRALRALAAVAVAAPLLARADGTAPSRPIQVALYGYPVDLPHTVAGAFAGEPDAFATTTLAVSQLTDEGLAGFDCLVARLGAQPPPPAPQETTATFEAIARFVARGGCYVGDWWGAGAALSSLAATAWIPPSGVLGLFSGEADGGFIGTGTYVQLTGSHPVTDGLPPTFTLGSGSEFFVRPIEPLDPRLQVIATVDNYGVTQPALLVGSTGRANAVLILFDAGDAPYSAYAQLLFRNAVRWAATTPVDAAAPVTVASLAGAMGKNGWYVSDVSVTLSASDGTYGSGVASTEYAIDGGAWRSYAGPFTISSEGTTEVAWRSTDVAGNVEDAKTLELRIDEDRPVISLASPAAGAVYALRQPVLASWSASDAVSGPLSTTATTPNGDPIDTLSVGWKKFSIAAEDLAGNTAVAEASYAVRYVFGGWLKPLVADGTGVHKLKGTIPVRFQLRDGAGLPVATAVAGFRVVKIADAVVGTTEVDTVATDPASLDDQFQWDAAAQAYVYHLSPRDKNLTPGTWEIQAVLDDGTTHGLGISFR